MLKRIIPLIMSFCFFITAAAQVSIKGYRNAIIPAAASDYRGSMLQTFASKSGMNVIRNASSLSEDELLKTCVIEMSQYGTLTQYCNLTVKDLVSTQMVAHTSEWCRFRVGVPACIEGSIENAWDALKYKGYEEKAYEENLNILFPKRPTIDINEQKIKTMRLLNPLEGIWTDNNSRYTIGIIKDSSKNYADYIGIVLKSNTPVWTPGEIKFEFKETSSGNAFMGNIYMGDKTKQGTTFTIENNNTLLRFETRMRNNNTDRATYVKIFPKVNLSIASSEPNFDNLNSIIEENAQKVSPDRKYRLAVMPIIQTEAKQYIDKGFGTFITEKITSTLGSMGPNIRLYERSRLDAILHEQALVNNGLFNEQEVKKLGELAPIDFILTGTYTRLDKSITLNVRFIDVVTGEVSTSFSCEIPVFHDLETLFENKIPN
ncbi:MAG: FlgO family outer membrane protein [Holophaga sp.]